MYLRSRRKPGEATCVELPEKNSARASVSVATRELIPRFRALREPRTGQPARTAWSDTAVQSEPPTEPLLFVPHLRTRFIIMLSRTS